MKTFKPNSLLAVEPMLSLSPEQTKGNLRAWSSFTADSSLSVRYEADVLMMEYGPRDLTEGMDQLQDVVG